MEDFDAIHRTPWETIDEALQQCDYYVLIVGDRYGSIEPESNISYTEKEYHRARELKKPALVFLREAARKTPKRTKAERQLEAFKKVLRTDRVVVSWRNTNELIEQILEQVPRFIQKHGHLGGWVRARDYAFRRDAYAFLLNRLLPFGDFRVADTAFERVRDRKLDSIRDVLDALGVLLDGFRQAHLAADMRAYFAYRLEESVRIKEEESAAYTDVHYRIGISSAAEGSWREGLAIGLNSNVEVVYTNADITAVADASSWEVRNQNIVGEKSVIAAPVMFGPDAVIGAIGFSSPRIGEAALAEYRDLAREVQTIASALFHGYAQPNEKGMTVKKMRDQIARALDTRLQPLMSRKPRSSRQARS